MNFTSIKECRRFFHTMPEPGWLEFQTTINIIKILKEIGYEVEYGKSIHAESRMGLPDQVKVDKFIKLVNIDVDFDISEILDGYTGAIVTLETGKPGPKIGFRFDIDGLEIIETSDDNHLPNQEGFRSKIPGTMHACGHDGHLSIGLFLAKWLKENKDQLKGSYTIVFQPAEEGVRGGKSMSTLDRYKDIDYMLGMHLGINLPSGTISVGTIDLLATAKFDIEYRGVSAHAGGFPEQGKNALLAACSACLNLETLAQHSAGMSRINVGTLSAGSGRNVIPNLAKIQLEVRGENNEIVEYLSSRTKHIAKGSAIQYELEYDIDEVGGAPALSGHDYEFYEEITDLLKNKGYNIINNHGLGASEDVTYFFNKVRENGGKALHLLVGSDRTAGHHNEKFDFNEDDLDISLDLFKEIVMYLQDK